MISDDAREARDEAPRLRGRVEALHDLVVTRVRCDDERGCGGSWDVLGAVGTSTRYVEVCPSCGGVSTVSTERTTLGELREEESS